MLTTRNPDRRRTTSTTVRGLAALLLSAMVGCAHSPDVTTEPVDPGYASVQEDAPERACAVDVSDDGELMVEGTAVAGVIPKGAEAVDVATWPWTGGSVLLARLPEWERAGWPELDGRLWEITCGGSPKAAVFFEEEGADLGHAALSPNGKTLYYSGVNGVMALDLAERKARRLTRTPPVDARTCGDAVEPGATMRDVVQGLSKDGRALRFERGAPCGYGGGWSARPWILARPDEPGLARVRAPRPVASVAADAKSEALWLADGGRCDEPGAYDHQTIGAVWRSLDAGVTWSQVAVDVGYGADEMVTAARVVLSSPRPGHVAVLSQLCTTSAATTGGSVFFTRDHGDTWEALLLVGAPARDDTALGQGIEALALVDEGLAQLDVWIDGERLRVQTADGKVTRLDPAPPPPPPAAASLGGARFEATADGLFRRGEDDAPLRVFPPR